MADRIKRIKKDLRGFASKEKAETVKRFFKIGPGEYGEGDIFLGVKVPEVRKVSEKYLDIDLDITGELISSPIHEERLLALLIWIRKFERGENRKGIYDMYKNNLRYINNWDLVDLSAPKIIGAFLLKKKRDILYRLARARVLWKRRIAIVSTYTFIRNYDFNDTFKISSILLNDPEDLIHKAVGWMLREVGKRDKSLEERFLKNVYRTMPRTMLRYAIEHFAEGKRQLYLKGKV